ncbi:MAG: stage II sporulation protein E [Defluviitaleaceae bacterium]|nr:stage II sporulation protein E [Defluviitaleaceae bacterium]MCL2273364.1 stage II sporulation protein E [Defluviitaleaceae bacterium]
MGSFPLNRDGRFSAKTAEKTSQDVLGTGFSQSLSKRDIGATVVGASGFFIGRAVVFGFINPLALPFLAAFMGSGRAFYVTALFTALGMATRLGDFFTWRYLMAVGLLCGYYFVALRVAGGHNRGWLKLPFIAAGASVLTSGLAFALLYGVTTFLVLVAVLEGVLASGLTLVIKRGHAVLTGKRRRMLAGEDIIAITILLAGIVAGASEIYVGAMPLRFFFCIYILCLVANKGGASFAAAAGMLLGVFLYLAGHWEAGTAAALSLAGMGGGLAKKWGRIAVIGGVVAAGSLALFVLARELHSFSNIYAVIAAGLAFMLTPQNFNFNVASAISPLPDNAEDYMDKIKEETTRRLNSFAGAFEKLADTFSGLSKPKHSLNKNDISLMVDELSARACATCPRYGRCWEDDLYATHQHIFSLLGACAEKGAATASDLDAVFRRSCPTHEKWLHELNAVFSLYKNNLLWHNRIAESRELVSQQLHGVAGIVQCLSDEIDISLKFHEGLEEEMILALLKHKIDVNSVIVMENKQGRYRVSISHRACFNKNACNNDILPVLNAVLKRKMRPEGTDCDTRGDACTVRFIEDQRLRISSGVAHRAKSSRGSGDSYSFMELKNGTCLLALSDGMGSGERARRESEATVGLLEDFIESGFDKELAVRMINSVLVLKSNEESFATLDICSVDLYTGDSEFIKIGAASTFLLRGGKVRVIRSSSLPIGMLNEVDLEVTRHTLAHNDVILMVTDGITPDIEREQWLANTLAECRFRNPQDIADYVLSEAERAKDGKKDDMTVLAARVWEKV